MVGVGRAELFTLRGRRMVLKRTQGSEVRRKDDLREGTAGMEVLQPEGIGCLRHNKARMAPGEGRSGW